jgi:hypothetical protein
MLLTLVGRLFFLDMHQPLKNSHYMKASYLHLEMVNCIGTFLLASAKKNSDLEILI